MAKRSEPPDLRRTLLEWYTANRRDLPWRRTSDPYAVWISEVMLQQTRVDTVVPYYEAFLVRWPTVEDLAAAQPDDVRSAWSGLGYYRRAKAMLDAAATIVRDFDGTIPTDPNALRALPGFGRYTAGAVASIAHGVATAAVDGNVLRVLARIDGVEGDVTRGEANKTIWARAESLAPGERPGDFNQALIELGATVCSYRGPRCDVCPVRTFCVAHQTARTASIPPPKVRAKRKRLDRTAILVVSRGPSVLLEQQPEGGLFGGLWCLPMVEGRLDADATLDEAARKYGFDSSTAEVVADVKNVLTHRDLFLRVVRVSDAPRRVPKPLVRAALAKLDEYGVPTLTVRALRASLTADELALATLPDRKSKRRAAGNGDD